jgi:hypothetical protein
MLSRTYALWQPVASHFIDCLLSEAFKLFPNFGIKFDGEKFRVRWSLPRRSSAASASATTGSTTARMHRRTSGTSHMKVASLTCAADRHLSFARCSDKRLRGRLHSRRQIGAFNVDQPQCRELERDGHGRHGSAQQPQPSLTLIQGGRPE